ncbi:hypothetical protein [Kibdelosporangium philippinense]|uniref:hypothetical protein n=1 Tax=Kibdelosporangium philippinense TaxID=211113 RepID=UPI0036084B53
MLHRPRTIANTRLRHTLLISPPRPGPRRRLRLTRAPLAGRRSDSRSATGRTSQPGGSPLSLKPHR